ncbi:coiled-coil domain-containing protein 157-like [Stylophora pistillata]|uniref:coiled-coil domain-containing protein 157-like n=1 Tax=Stylophora pistillata TaxID=50429 RepID=UPI000C0570C0|nr:coiled-coil domain-containing protein 157-like [Stylophora pistillata]
MHRQKDNSILSQFEVTGSVARSDDKHKIEVELCEKADFVVGVGPKLGEENNKLSTELDKESKEVESDVQQMKIEMDDSQVKLKDTSIELGKTQARNKTLEKHEQELSLESSTPSQELTLAVEDVTHAKTCQESSTQTYDTAFIPCEACARTQQNLIEVGNMVIKVCESQGLPSSLAKQKKLLRQSLMAAADLSRWASEQSQDLARITDHLDNLYAQINPLEDKLSRSKQVCAQLEKEIQDLEKQLLDKDSEGEKKEVDLKEKLKQVVAEKDLLLTDAEQLNNDLMKGKDVLQGMEFKLAQMLEKISPRRAYKNLLPCGNNTVTNLD